MGKWGKYPKNYNPKWEKEAALKNWLEPTSEEDCLKGKPHAYCKICHTHIRAHHSDLIIHSKSVKHQDKARSLNRNQQPSLHDYGCHQINDKSKITDLKIAVYVALHSTVRSVDHLNDLLKMLGKGSSLENVRLHRTKCSKLISEIVAPAFLKELVQDVGDSPFALIIDEATDVSVSKFMGLCIRYYSKSCKYMVTDFLGIIPVTSCTGADLANAVKDYRKLVGLPLNQLNAIGTDGAPNMCGAFNSLYTHLKKDVPNLLLLKCVCHSIDKCAEKAFKNMPRTTCRDVQLFWSQCKALRGILRLFQDDQQWKDPGEIAASQSDPLARVAARIRADIRSVARA